MFGSRLGFLINFGSDFGTTLNDFGWILDGFWDDFGRVFQAFEKDFEGENVEKLALMIRATRSRSIDR